MRYLVELRKPFGIQVTAPTALAHHVSHQFEPVRDGLVVQALVPGSSAAVGGVKLSSRLLGVNKVLGRSAQELKVMLVRHPTGVPASLLFETGEPTDRSVSMARPRPIPEVAAQARRSASMLRPRPREHPSPPLEQLKIKEGRNEVIDSRETEHTAGMVPESPGLVRGKDGGEDPRMTEIQAEMGRVKAVSAQHEREVARLTRENELANEQIAVLVRQLRNTQRRKSQELEHHSNYYDGAAIVAEFVSMEVQPSPDKELQPGRAVPARVELVHTKTPGPYCEASEFTAPLLQGNLTSQDGTLRPAELTELERAVSDGEIRLAKSKEEVAARTQEAAALTGEVHRLETELAQSEAAREMEAGRGRSCGELEVRVVELESMLGEIREKLSSSEAALQVARLGSRLSNAEKSWTAPIRRSGLVTAPRDPAPQRERPQQHNSPSGEHKRAERSRSKDRVDLLMERLLLPVQPSGRGRQRFEV